MAERLSGKYLAQVWPRLSREVRSLSEAAGLLGVKPQTLEKALERQGIYLADHGLPFSPPGPTKRDIAPTRHLLVEKFPEMRERGLNGVEMAEELGISVSSFRTALYRARKYGELPMEYLPLGRRRDPEREALLEEWEFLRESDVSPEEAAPRLGVGLDRLLQVLETARKNGDARGARSLAEVWNMRRKERAA